MILNRFLLSNMLCSPENLHQYTPSIDWHYSCADTTKSGAKVNKPPHFFSANVQLSAKKKNLSCFQGKYEGVWWFNWHDSAIVIGPKSKDCSNWCSYFPKRLIFIIRVNLACAHARRMDEYWLRKESTTIPWKHWMVKWTCIRSS